MDIKKINTTAFCIFTIFCLGCGSDEVTTSPAADPPATEQLSTGEIIMQVNASGKITDAQAEILSKITRFELREITDTSFQPTKSAWLELNGLTSMTDGQAESLSKVLTLKLNGLTSITDAQAESLSRCWSLQLNGLTSITDAQAESLRKVRSGLVLNGLTTITDEQAESLAKVSSLFIPEEFEPLIEKYKKQ